MSHENECIFEFHKCIQKKRNGVHLKLASKGKCAVPISSSHFSNNSTAPSTANNSTDIKFEANRPLGRRQCDFFCDEIAQPICDTKGVTHKNFCKFDLTNCRILSRGLPALQIAHAGRCEGGTQTSEEQQQFDLRAPSRKRWFFANQQQEPEDLSADNNQPSSPLKRPTTAVPDHFLSQKATTALENEKIIEKQIHSVKQFFAAVSEANNGSSGTIMDRSNNEPVTTSLETTTVSEPVSNSSSTAEVKLEQAVGVFGDDNDPAATDHNQWTFPGVVVNAATSFVGGSTDEGSRAVVPINKDTIPIAIPDAIVDSYGLEANSTAATPEYYCSAQSCDKVWDPVCDTQNTTHKNECLFRFHVCKLDKLSKGKVNAYSDNNTQTGWTDTTQPLKIAYYGKCGKYARRREPDNESQASRTSICKLCGQEDQNDVLPVCDNFNQTHQSICLFAEWNCERKLRDQEQRILVHIGACQIISPVFQLNQEECPHKCSKQYKPVCDTNGLTHPNLCTFQMFNCHHRRMVVMSKTDNAGWLRSLRACGDVPKGQNSTTTPGSTTLLPSSFVTTTLATQTILSTSSQAFPTSTTTTTAAPAPTTITTTTTMAAVLGGAIAECPERRCDHSSKEDRRICDSEGNLHDNECKFAHAHCLAAQQGRTLRIVEDDQCQTLSTSKTTPPLTSSPDECSEFNANCSTTDYDAYCGSDFHTYPNFCSFKQEQCSNNKELEIIFRGECQLCLNTPCPIIEPNKETNDSLFVCDQSGETKSKCEFEMLRCIYEIKFGYNITEAYAGKCCKDSEQCVTSASHNQLEQPVCDNNDKIYRNRCFYEVAACRASKISHTKLEESVCPQNVSKNAHYGNKTHDDASLVTRLVLNLCEFGRHRCFSEKTASAFNLSLVDYKACKQLQCTIDCPAIYEPICGSNGKTYANKCDLERSMCILKNNRNLTMDYKGECCPNVNCDLNFRPICDSLGRTHINECFFKKEACLALLRNNVKISIGYKGECCDASSCSQEFKPVCDGKETHLNMCHFRAKQCEADRRGELLRLVYAGECCLFPKGDCEHTNSLCDSDGVTLRNKCFFEFKKCNAQKIQQKSISVVHEGDCCKVEDCPTQYTNETNAVCDSKGVTHSSLCHFKNTKCIFEKINLNSTLMVEYTGRCCENKCDDIYEPVCDQHGNTYVNKCLLVHSSSPPAQPKNRKGGSLRRTKSLEIIVLLQCVL
uniref:Kazal-like domain-containing protein n=1 Tax=Ditylenchus dipsaci TaxID=166011 RepID=A0A915E7C0_9BILA